MSAATQTRRYVKGGVKRVDNALLAPIDLSLLVAMAVIIGLGLVMVASASLSIAEHQTGNAHYFLTRQIALVAIALIVAYICFQIPMSLWQRLAPWLLVAAFISLALVLVPGVGVTVNGARRWVNLVVIRLQPSEFAKLAFLIYLAGYLQCHQKQLGGFVQGFVRPLAIFVAFAFLLLLEPDFGSVVVLAIASFGLMFLAGVKLYQFAILLLIGGASLGSLAVFSPYRLARLTSFLDPWQDPFNSGFQLVQALISFGRGGWFGVGLGGGVQKLSFLPEAHTDFLFSVMAEELGLVSVLIVIGLFGYIVLRSFRIAYRCQMLSMPFAAYVTYGIALMLGMQAFINMGVNMGVLPTKGLTLPLMSYGGSSILVTCVCCALLLRADYEMRQKSRKMKQQIW
ncbi:MAG: putative lipid II flippase FtsW [Gammaproteobacteria bacterium]|nr:putative lipid II flippase FtsW [Gammaproteobacteria bacterium]